MEVNLSPYVVENPSDTRNLQAGAAERKIVL
jgi:hypothetical protein